MFTVEHDPDGFACNMGYVVRNASGGELYRGPEWACHYRARAWNDGRETDEDRRLREQVECVAHVVDTLRTIFESRQGRG